MLQTTYVTYGLKLVAKSGRGCYINKEFDREKEKSNKNETVI